MKRSRRSTSDPPRTPARALVLSTLTLALMCAFAGNSSANPNGASVVSGQATITSSGRTLSITNAPGTIINWRGFSIAADELTRFIQQSATSAVLNRVVGQDPSSLLGRLQSNGRVFLINPNGIVFGAGARIDVGGLVASTLDLGDADFLSGRLHFSGPASAGTLTQLGSITTPAGGQVVLIAPKVENSGVIHTPQGEILLAAGHSVQLVDSANPALRVTVAASAGEARNLGELLAEGGRVGIHAGLIGQSGAISADRAEAGPAGEVYLRASGGIDLGLTSRISAGGASGGRITIDAGNGAASVSGALAATGGSGSGGSVHVFGRDVRVGAATVDVSGTSGGGEILIGGDFQGGNPDRPNARTSVVGSNVALRADALDNGRGGKVIVWADDSTAFAGTVSARGGANGGNGGFVEVSGRQTLAFDGRVDTTAARGATGTLLLDPSDITISTAADASISGGPAFTGTAASSTLNVTTLQTALASNNVIVDTTSGFAGAGNIGVNNAVTWASANSLELRAHNNITVAGGATINATGNGALRLIANQDSTGGGDVSINAALTARAGGITISGANISSVAAGTLTTTGLAGADAGAVSVTGTGAVGLTGAINAVGGSAPPLGGPSVPGRAGGAVSISGTTVATSTITASGSAGAGSPAAGGNAGTVSVVGSGAVTTGAITASTGAAIGTGAGGTPGSISVQGTTVTTGPLTTTGGANGAGGAIQATATSGLLQANGAIISSGGTANASSAGRNAGNITLSGVGVNVNLPSSVTANGSNATTAGSNQPGGAGGAVLITSTGGVTSWNVSASGGNATTTNAAGGNGGSITIANSGAGDVNMNN
ncbi:MAG: filamentous hemagglutinin N-terminal domain-containing protein, partial [Caldimonas sp.]